MNKMTRESIERQVVLVLMIGVFFLIPVLLEDVDMKTVLYSWFVVIIGFIIYNVWFNTTKDYINNEKQKISFLNEEFDYLVNSVVEGEGFGYFWLKKRKKKKVKYKVTDIIISPPRKIQEDEWEVFIQMENLSLNFSVFYSVHEFLETDNVKILNISDIEFDKIMINKKEFTSLINPVKKTMSGLTILNPDVFKKDKN